MTQDEIIAMARQVGVEIANNAYYPFFIEELEAFAKLVAAHEREACAKLCETGIDTEHPTVKGHIMNNFGASSLLAEAIRARGQQ